MDKWKSIAAGLMNRWQSLAVNLRIGLAIGAVVAVALLLFLGSRANQPSMKVLFSQLATEDAARIEERLRGLGVPYSLEANGSTILVAEDKVHEVRMALASEGLLGQSHVGFELFDDQRFGESEFAEQIKYHRAIEGELSRTISHLAGVQQARVHLVMPRRSLFAEEEKAASASVALHLRPGWKMRQEQVDGIIRLVASSVRGLDSEQVAVVDGEGNLLSGSQGGDGEATSGALAYRRSIEAEKEKSAQKMLDGILGKGRSMVRIAADVSMTREERTEEEFFPSTIATRSFQISEETDGSGKETAAGIPGAVSNLPGGEPGQSQNLAGRGIVRRSETRNFEVSKKVRHAVEPVGKVDRLHAAVVVDGHWSKGKKGAPVFKSRSAEELQRLSSLLSHALGIRQDRGDQLTVECVAFHSRAAGEQAPDLLQRFEPYLPYGAGLLLALLAVPLLLLRRKRGGKPSLMTASVAKLSMANQAAGGKALAPSNDLSIHELYDTTLQLASENPGRAANVVRSWLHDGSRSTGGAP